MEELIDLIEQCETEEGLVPKPLQPLSSMPVLSPRSPRRRTRRETDTDTSSSDDASSEVGQVQRKI